MSPLKNWRFSVYFPNMMCSDYLPGLNKAFPPLPFKTQLRKEVSFELKLETTLLDRGEHSKDSWLGKFEEISNDDVYLLLSFILF
jgi:hypothetical protein